MFAKNGIEVSFLEINQIHSFFIFLSIYSFQRWSNLEGILWKWFYKEICWERRNEIPIRKINKKWRKQKIRKFDLERKVPNSWLIVERRENIWQIQKSKEIQNTFKKRFEGFSFQSLHWIRKTKFFFWIESSQFFEIYQTFGFQFRVVHFLYEKKKTQRSNRLVFKWPRLCERQFKEKNRILLFFTFRHSFIDSDRSLFGLLSNWNFEFDSTFSTIDNHSFSSHWVSCFASHLFCFFNQWQFSHFSKLHFQYDCFCSKLIIYFYYSKTYFLSNC